jgi:hypothetical protein
MKKIKLNTSTLKLKKEEISSLTNGEMRQVVGGSGVCGTYPCVQSVDVTCPTPLPTPTPSGTTFHCN